MFVSTLVQEKVCECGSGNDTESRYHDSSSIVHENIVRYSPGLECEFRQEGSNHESGINVNGDNGNVIVISFD